MYNDTLDQKLVINGAYNIEYNFDPTWGMQSLLCPIITIPGLNIPFVPRGGTLYFVNSRMPSWAGVTYKGKLIGAIPKAVIDDYSSKGYILWGANYHVFNNRPTVWMELK